MRHVHRRSNYCIRRHSRPSPLAACLLAALGLGGIAESALATIVLVSRCDDTRITKGGYTLRQAIGHAGNNDEVDMSALTCGTITLASGEVPITVDNLVIRGRTNAPITIDAGLTSRVFDHTGVGRVSLIGVNATAGQYFGPGGCVYSKGSLYLDFSTVSGCRGVDKGGGIFAAYDLELHASTLTANNVGANNASRGGGAYVGRSLLVEQSTISNNIATSDASTPGDGGGIFVRSGASIRLSTVSGNSAGIAGAIEAVLCGGFDLEESTVSGNTASSVGGIRIGPCSGLIYNSTIAFNQTTSAMANSGAACKAAAGICVYGNISGTPTRLRSTIIANNTNTADATASADLYSTQPLSGASNLIVSANVTPPGTLGGDPQLGPLVDNGGGTLTHALAPTSPAIDAGDPNGWSTDQRSKPRVAGGAADIGAYELQVNDVIFRNGFD